jgi:hypothetical protein
VHRFDLPREKENKRLKDPRDKETLKAFKKDIFDESIPVQKTIRKYFKLTKEWHTTDNIAYRNTTCQKISEEARRRILKKLEPYEPGEVLICRSYFKMKRVVFHVNYEYHIEKVEGSMVHLLGGIAVPMDLIKKNFTHNYCRTCHSFQGSSINKPITIFDWKFVHVNRKWLYTAVTRARDLKKVVFYDYEEAKEDKEQMLQYFQHKVEKYKQQDKKAKRVISENSYITKEILAGWVGLSCNSCGDCLTYSRAGGKVDCNISAQRVDNNECHSKENVVPYCVYCNTAVSNRE